MRYSAIIILVCAALHTACGRSPAPPTVVVATKTAQPAAPAAPAPRVLGPEEAVCRVLEPDPATEHWGWEVTVWEVQCGGPGRLELLWGDRFAVSEAGEQSSKGNVSESSTVEAGTIRVEFAWRFKPGEEVLRDYLQPIGGDEAMAALRQAVPGIEDTRLGSLRMLSATKTGKIWSEFPVQRESMPPKSASSATNHRPAGTEIALPAGKHVLLWQRAWSDTSGVSTTSLIRANPPRVEVDGKPVPLSEYPLPVWLLYVRFTPR